MDSMRALAILAFCAGIHAAALPQISALGAGTTTAVGPATGSAAVGVAIGTPTPPVAAAPVPGLALPRPVSDVALPKAPAALPNVGGGGLPVPLPNAGGGGVPVALPNVGAGGLPGPLPNVGGDSLPVPSLPKLPNVDGIPIPSGLPTTPDVPKLPSLGDGLPLPIPSGGPGSKLPVVGEVPVPLPVPIPEVPDVAGGDLTSGDAITHVVKLGSAVFELILGILSKGASLFKLPGTELLHSLPVGALPNGSLPISKRQLGLPLPQATPSAGSALGSTPVVGGVTAGLPLVGGGSSPAGAVTGAVGGVTGGGSSLAPVSGALGTVANTAGSVPVAGSAAAPVLNTVGGASGSGSPLGAVSNTVGTAAGAANSIPVGGSIVGGAVNSLPVAGGGSGSSVANTNPNINPLPFTGIPGADPVGAFSISVIATLLSMLKKDPLSLFAPSLPIPALVKRDLPNLHERDIPELAKRQLNFLPSLSSGVPGVGVGALPGSGIPGVPPDLAFLVGSIAKNIAVPGGTGLGSITSKILTVLNGVVPNFLFQLPVVQDSVPTFGVLQLLSSINPTKFRDLAGLTNLSALQQAASTIPAGDLAFIRGLPQSPDPTNLITTIMTLSDNILSCPGNVANLKATVAVLCMRNLGLAVAGL